MGREVDPELPRDEFTVEILRYVVAHPKAKDTISGIEQWWLSAGTSGEGKKKLESVLNQLVTRGWLSCRRSPQAESIYSLNEDGVHDIQEFLNEDPKRRHP